MTVLYSTHWQLLYDHYVKSIDPQSEPAPVCTISLKQSTNCCVLGILSNLGNADTVIDCTKEQKWTPLKWLNVDTTKMSSYTSYLKGAVPHYKSFLTIQFMNLEQLHWIRLSEEFLVTGQTFANHLITVSKCNDFQHIHTYSMHRFDLYSPKHCLLSWWWGIYK